MVNNNARWDYPQASSLGHNVVFVNEALEGLKKIEYIKTNCDNILFLIVGPLVSTFLIIWILPRITNLAHKITLEFDEQRRKQKNETFIEE